MKWVLFFAGACSLLVCASCSTATNISKSGAQALPFVMGKDDTISMQRPDLPDTQLIVWTPENRLYRSVVVDYVEGMSQRSYIFNKPNQIMYRDMLVRALDRAGLLARSPIEARYALQISFDKLDADAIGLDFAGRSQANYRIVSRLTGEIVYEGDVNANFLVKYPELNEADVAKAYDISIPGFAATAQLHALAAADEGILTELINNNSDLTDFFGGPYYEASQAVWDDYNQAFIWTEGVSLLLGPLEILREQLDPSNYISLASRRKASKSDVRGDRHGFLSESGIGARDGKERGLQASERMLGQSITKFLIDLAALERVRYKVILPCTMNEEVRAMKLRLMSAGIGYRSEPCNSDRYDEFEIGVGYTEYQ